MTYERGIRKCFESSLNKLNNQFRDILDKISEVANIPNLLTDESPEVNVENALQAGYDPVFWTFMIHKQILSVTLKYDKTAK